MTNDRAEKAFNRTFMVAWLAWALSLFLPAAAIRHLEIQGMKGDIVIPGWQAATICALNPSSVTDDSTKPRGVVAVVVRLMGLTNLVMATSLTTLVTRRRAVKHAFMFVALGAAWLNAHALIWYATLLSYGYAVWLASFVLLALALSRDRRPTSPF